MTSRGHRRLRPEAIAAAPAIKAGSKPGGRMGPQSMANHLRRHEGLAQ
jgi:hypothetical protein